MTVLLAGRASTNSRDEEDGQGHLPALNSGLEDSVLLFVWTQPCFLPASAGTTVEWYEGLVPCYDILYSFGSVWPKTAEWVTYTAYGVLILRPAS